MSVQHTLMRRRALDYLIRPTRAEVDLPSLRHNFAEARKIAGSAEVLAVIKANAYGHGAVPVARELEAQGVALLGVALVEEGVELRNAGVLAPILVMGGSYLGGFGLIVEHNLVPTVFQPEHVVGLSRAAAGRTVKVHLKVDTGMGRLGVELSELPVFLDLVAAHPSIQIDGLMSHLASADEVDAALNRLQVERFAEALAQVQARGLSPRYRHLANSAALMHPPEVIERLGLNLVRPGLLLFGYAPAPGLEHRSELRPVLTWKTAITHLKTVPVGTPISYGATWVAPRRSVIATLPVGYADGYSRQYSSKASVLVRGQRARICGRVCMDMCMVDVTDVPDVALGDEAVLLGSQEGQRITAEELAELSQTLHYEVLCAVGARVPRVLRTD